MGICSSQTGQRDNQNRKQEQQPLASNNTNNNLTTQGTVVRLLGVEQVYNPNPQNPNPQRQEGAKPVENPKPQQPINQNPPNEGDDEFYLQDIMKQFDELNNLFQQMSEEFENMSKYLASINDE